MKTQGYFIFHINLGFSSVEREARDDLIKLCYHPLLDWIELNQIPVGIEITGWSLEELKKFDPKWVKKLKCLISSGLCELIGSGYSQLIGPLVPHNVNEWNQQLGREVYQEILGCQPRIALTNEMAFSNSMVDLYHVYGYDGFVLDRRNLSLALGSEDKLGDGCFVQMKGPGGSVLPVLWSDSILFQKFQQFVHGDINLNDYLLFIEKFRSKNNLLLPIYTNDAEVFDYRPGRFQEELSIHPEGEWNRINKLIYALKEEIKIDWLLPSEALEVVKMQSLKTVELNSTTHPISVKKQAKYNIARWAVTGRDDLWINSECHRISNHAVQKNIRDKSILKLICKLWMSDLRTHITEKRWQTAKKELDELLKTQDLNQDNRPKKRKVSFKKLDLCNQDIGNFTVSVDEEKVYLSIKSHLFSIVLNLRKGMCLKNLSFSSHGKTPCLGTRPHGYFECISMGADFFSGGVTIELPLGRTRITDLKPITPFVFLMENGDLLLKCEINSVKGIIEKIYRFSSVSEKINIEYNFPNWEPIIGVVRLANLTLLSDFAKQNTLVSLANGGPIFENFHLKAQTSHIAPASTLVSSANGLGATTGEIQLRNSDKLLFLKWDPSVAAAMPMLQHIQDADKYLSRIFFSLMELDDTKKAPSPLRRFSLNISSQPVLSL